MQTFYSNGKLLITGEYVVLDGANAFALPTKKGQSLTITPINDSKIVWKSVTVNNKVWFEHTFSLDNLNSTNNTEESPVAKRLLDILIAAKTLNPDFLSSNQGYKVTTKLDFATDWGLGSSSTLLNNIAQWAKIDPFKLSNLTFGGSGYDIACASNNTAIIYNTLNNNTSVKPIDFLTPFLSHVFFIHLNKKQNSRASIKTYQTNKQAVSQTVSQINLITAQLIQIKTLSEFENLITEHERLIGEITNQTPVKELLFSDYKQAIKSLGGWGGDFILATGDFDYVQDYFKTKGYTTIVSYDDMIL